MKCHKSTANISTQARQWGDPMIHPRETQHQTLWLPMSPWDNIHGIVIQLQMGEK